MANNRNVATDLAVYDAMQDGKPFKRYEKTILGRVHLTIISPFSGEVENVILSGNPDNASQREASILNIWTQKEDQFLHRMNRVHFNKGNLVELKEEDVPQVYVSENQVSEEEIEEVLNKPFLALKNKLNSFTSVAPCYRFLRAAEEMEKSEKILEAIRARISEIELGDLSQEE